MALAAGFNRLSDGDQNLLLLNQLEKKYTAKARLVTHEDYASLKASSVDWYLYFIALACEGFNVLYFPRSFNWSRISHGASIHD